MKSAKIVDFHRVNKGDNAIKTKKFRQVPHCIALAQTRDFLKMDRKIHARKDTTFLSEML